jgi:hypothetical protein
LGRSFAGVRERRFKTTACSYRKFHPLGVVVRIGDERGVLELLKLIKCMFLEATADVLSRYDPGNLGRGAAGCCAAKPCRRV